MAYEATVPVHRRLLWSAVTDPERLLGAVPNLAVEASTEQGVAARLRLRVGDHSITFRGIARLVEVVPEQLRAVLEIEAVHGRSDGALEGRVELRLLAAGSGTRVVVEPELVLSGHAPAIAPARLAEAGARLIPRWFDQLASASPEPRAAAAATALTVVPDDAPAPRPASAPSPAPAPAPQDPPEAAPPAEPHGPTLTLITGDAQDETGGGQKAPLRLVSDDAERAAAQDAEPDLWSRGRGRLPGPLWFLAAALVGMAGLAGLAALLLRRLLRRR
jgi:carbon monoxide dehydrogenase subunit G